MGVGPIGGVGVVDGAGEAVVLPLELSVLPELLPPPEEEGEDEAALFWPYPSQISLGHAPLGSLLLAGLSPA